MAPVVAGSDGVLALDSAGLPMIAIGTTVPTDGVAGYGPGCLFLKTDPAGPQIYLNEGTSVSADFDQITVT